MLSQAVHPPTTEHVYAQWQEREELSSRAPLGLLEEDNVQNFDIKEEEALSPMSREPTSLNHFKSSRLKFKGSVLSLGGNALYFKGRVSSSKFLLVCLRRKKRSAFKS